MLPKNKACVIIISILVTGYWLLVTPTAQALTISPPRIETSTDAGRTLEHEIKIINEEKSSRTLYIVAQNFEAKDESGEPNYVQGTENLAGWIKAPKSVDLGPGEEKLVKFTINVPPTAEPGGYFTALFFQSDPPTFEQGAGIGIGSQLGSLILLKVNGAIGEEAGVLEFATKNKDRTFLNLPIEFFYRFQNTGDTWVKPLGEVFITNTFGRRVKLLNANRQKGNVLPKSIRKFETAWVTSGGNIKEDPNVEINYPSLNGFWENVKYQYNHFALGLYTAELHLAYGTDPVQVGESKYKFFVFPWQLVLVGTLTTITALFLFSIFIKKYNRRIIQKAQTQITKEAISKKNKKVEK